MPDPLMDMVAGSTNDAAGGAPNYMPQQPAEGPPSYMPQQPLQPQPPINQPPVNQAPAPIPPPMPTYQAPIQQNNMQAAAAMQMPAAMASAQPHIPIQPGTGNYYKDVIAAKKEITTATKELKVHKIDLACGAM